MDRSGINPEAEIEEPVADLDDDYGYRPVLLEGFTPVDGSNVIVPVGADRPESFILALTERQAEQALVCLATQIGDVRAHALVGALLRQDKASK